MRKLYLLSGFILLFLQTPFAQTPTDGLMMNKGLLCVLGQYSNSSWENYWEGTKERSNLNLGKFTSQNVMLMAAYGITDKINVLAGVPYVWTSSDSYLDGQSGLQDLAVFLKYQPLALSSSFGTFKVQATGGLSFPVSDYVPDFLPFSIGIRSKTASLRGILNYTTTMGFYATAQVGHTWRSNTHLDRDSYLFDNQQYESDEVPVPNVLDMTGRLGFINSRVQAEFFFDRFACLSGDDIRYNEMPLPTNKMEATSAGVFAKYFIWKGLAAQASYAKVLSGRNAGKATTISAGFTWFFRVVPGNKEEAAK